MPKIGKLLRRKSLIWCLLPAIFSSGLYASPATFVTALPVATDQLLVRFNFQPSFGTSGFTSMQFPVNIGYGLSPRLTLFANTNEGFGSLTQSTPAEPVKDSAGGLGDFQFFARYTIFQIDQPDSTLRIAPLAGAFLPTGENDLHNQQGVMPGSLQTGSGTVDPYLGVTFGYNNADWGLAADTTYRDNTATSQGVSPGNELRADAQFEYRLFPLELPEEGLPSELVLSIESNYVQDDGAYVNGIPSANSGGRVFKQDAILEWATLHWQLGLGAQLPVMQDLAGTGRIKERSAIFAFFEYYLAGPQ